MIGLGTIINKYSGGSRRRIAGTGSEKRYAGTDAGCLKASCVLK